MTTNVTGLFDTYSDAESAVRNLKSLGIPESEISIVASHRDGTSDTDAASEAGTGAGIGAVVGGAGGLLTGLGVMAIPGVGPVVAAGWLVATAVGAVAGAVAGGAVGGLVGALTDAGVPERDAHVYAEGVRRGGTLVTARVTDDAKEMQARSILKDANHVDLDSRRTAYTESGWDKFDDTAAPYKVDEVAAERDRYRRTNRI